jgi:DNA polymerase III delta prime subunit
MDQININDILDRDETSNAIKQILQSFDENCKNVTFKKGIYIYGSPGCGKTQFVINILNELNYDVIKYDAGDVRNKSLIDTITSNNISNRNVLHMMKGTTKKIAIVMDEIDGMNNGDKGGITSLIKLIRQKKTRKQKLENMTLNPIICIGNYYVDKKIRELMKVCNTFELQSPTTVQMSKFVGTLMPDKNILSNSMSDKILSYIQGDMRKLAFIYNIYKKKPELMTEDTICNIFHIKSYNEDAKRITKTLINHPTNIQKHNSCMNETDRTIVALLWHENIVDTLAKTPPQKAFPFYNKILENICFADYTDRITFQNQIWQFNEMSSLMKTFYNNKLYHDHFPENTNKFKTQEIRFTKVLTKYSTEYNNILFIYNLCQELDMDRKDLIAFFQELRLFCGTDFYNQPETLGQVAKLFENNDISKLDIKRMYRYLDKNVKKDVVVAIDDELSDLDE